jgi:hypothetical protein
MLDTQSRKKVKFFVGKEVENTAMKNQTTLFVVGVQNLVDIVRYTQQTEVEHVYLGTSQSFTPKTEDDWRDWDNIINRLLNLGYWVTLDYDVQYAEKISQMNWHLNNHFINMISVKIPNIKTFNANTVIKLDDITWGATNTGVWTHDLDKLMTQHTYTDWSEYKGDHPVDIDSD